MIKEHITDTAPYYMTSSHCIAFQRYNMIKEQGPEKVKRWTKKVKPTVFEKDLVSVPEN